jgi:hypothetical protein
MSLSWKKCTKIRIKSERQKIPNFVLTNRSISPCSASAIKTISNKEKIKAHSKSPFHQSINVSMSWDVKIQIKRNSKFRFHHSFNVVISPDHQNKEKRWKPYKRNLWYIWIKTYYYCSWIISLHMHTSSFNSITTRKKSNYT